MVASVSYDEVEVGTQLPAQTFSLRRVDLIMYAGASGDFNPIHWNERVATSVGLPDVIAHGMLTMAEAGRVISDWVGDPGAILEYGVRFSTPIPIPDDDVGTALHVGGWVEKKLDDRKVSVALEAKALDATVLTKARAIVQLA